MTSGLVKLHPFRIYNIGSGDDTKVTCFDLITNEMVKREETVKYMHIH